MNSSAWWLAMPVLMVACATDIAWRRIPNWLVLPVLAGGPVYGLLCRGWHGLERSVEGALMAIVPLGILFLLHGMGGGDVKLGAAVGAWIGPQQMIFALLVAGMFGGLLAATCAVRWRELIRSLSGPGRIGAFNEWRRAAIDVTPGLSIPYAPAIAAGTLFSFLML